MGGKKRVPAYKKLYFSNRKLYYKRKKEYSYRQNYKQRRQEAKVRARAKSDGELYRYSIAYDSGHYGKTFRAEVYLDHQVDEKRIRNHLDKALFNHMTKTNKGLYSMYRRSTYVGFEAERVGNNDKGSSRLNRVYYEIG